MSDNAEIPGWLATPQNYEPRPDRSSFIAKSLLSLASALRQLRLDDGLSGRLSPTAPVKLALAFGAIIVNSLATNLMVTLVLLAFVLVRAAFLPRRALVRAAAVAGMAALLSFVLMLPAIFLGQPASAVRLSLKALVSTGLAMELALTTPAGRLTGALRAFHVPNLVIMTIDLALKSIVQLGDCALETLTALSLRSVGRDDDRHSSMAAVGGTLFVRSSIAAQKTYDAMRCRCFTGTYDTVGTMRGIHGADIVWIVAFLLVIVLAAHLEGVI